MKSTAPFGSCWKRPRRLVGHISWLCPRKPSWRCAVSLLLSLFQLLNNVSMAEDERGSKGLELMITARLQEEKGTWERNMKTFITQTQKDVEITRHFIPILTYLFYGWVDHKKPWKWLDRPMSDYHSWCSPMLQTLAVVRKSSKHFRTNYLMLLEAINKNQNGVWISEKLKLFLFLTSSNLARASVLLTINAGQGSAWNLRLASRTKAAPRSEGARFKCAFSKSNTSLDWNW